MSGTLDQFLPPAAVKPKEDPKVFVEERCSNPQCRKILKPPLIKYTLRIKGKESPYCQECAKKILRPHENTEEKIVTEGNL